MLNKAKDRKYVLSSKVTFQEIILVKIYVMNVKDKWEVGNI